MLTAHKYSWLSIECSHCVDYIWLTTMERSMNSNFYVYAHRRATNGSIFYVGKGRGRRASSPAGRNPYWRNVVAKHGFTVEIVSGDHTEAEAFEIEKEMIARLRAEGVRLTNVTNGGEGSTGLVHTAEFKAALSARTKGNKINLGRVLSDEHKAKISAASSKITDETKAVISAKMAGIPKSAETRARMSAAQKGRTFSAETRAKMRAAALGRKASEETRAKMRAKTVTEETRAKLSATSKGRKHTPETRAKIAANHWRKSAAQKQDAAACLLATSSPSAAAAGRLGD